MSMLTAQIDELRLMGDGQAAKGEFAVATLLREAADTIESLRDRLQPVPAELDYIEDKSRWFELFGTPERAARTLLYVFACKDSRPWVACEECPILGGCAVRSDGHDALLDWLRGDAE